MHNDDGAQELGGKTTNSSREKNFNISDDATKKRKMKEKEKGSKEL